MSGSDTPINPQRPDPPAYRMGSYILYAEDNVTDYTFFDRSFRGCNPDISLVHRANGKLCRDFLLERLAAGDELPRVTIVDIKMPGLTGLELLEWIREHPLLCRLPVLVLSASAEKRDIERAYHHNVNAYLTKPERYGDLKVLVKSICTFWTKFNHVER